MPKWFQSLLIVINFLLYFVIVGTWLILTEYIFFNLILTAVNLVLSLVLIWLNKKEFQSYYESPRFRFTSQAVFSGIILFCLLSLLNYLVYKHPIASDLTVYKLHTLTRQSQRVLAELEQPIVFKIFSSKTQSRALAALVELYRQENSKISYEVIDPNLRPDLAEEYLIQNEGRMVATLGKKRAYVKTNNELGITNALVALSIDKKTTICFLEGHGEGNFKDESGRGFSGARQLLLTSGLNTLDLILETEKEVPEACRALVIWGAKDNFSDETVEKILKAKDRGIGLMIAVKGELTGAKNDSIEKILAVLGTKVQHSVALDLEQNVEGSGGTMPLVNRYPDGHPITENFQKLSFYPLSVSFIKDRGAKLFRPIVQTMGQEAWGELSLNEIVEKKPKFDQGADHPGPLSLVVALGDTQSGRTLLFGTPDLVANIYQKFQGNFQLFLNGVNWVSSRDQLISFDLPQISDEPVFVSRTQINLIFYFSVIFLPLILLTASVIVFRRKSR